MTKSMTAFARLEDGDISWEIRSVNHRYLDATFKMPEEFRGLETELRNRLKDKLARGKVDCMLRVGKRTSAVTDYVVNEAAVHKLRTAVDHVSRIMGKIEPLNPLEVLRFPGIMDEQQTQDDDELKQVSELFQRALDSLVQMRQREGDELARIVEEKLAELQAITGQVREAVPVISQRLKERLSEKLAELQVDVDAGRLEQELVYQAQKSDVTEELDRLATHIEEVRSALADKNSVGRRLDFLMQELNREANTLSSKATLASTTIQAVELKVIIEQMREQIQNIE